VLRHAAMIAAVYESAQQTSNSMVLGRVVNKINLPGVAVAIVA